MKSVGLDPALPVKVVDVMRAGSYALTFPDMLKICAAIDAALADKNAVGVVVTHGTDTLEESAYLADLLLADDRPVIFTGAQRPADHPDPDGPDNLKQAVAVATSREAWRQGSLVVFNGDIFRAAGTRKIHTSDLHAFDDPDAGRAGSVSSAGTVQLVPPSQRPAPFPLDEVNVSHDLRVDVIACHPGADGSLLRAALNAGTSGVVLQATGNGNANPRMVAVVQEAVAAGIPVVTSTRVQAGPVVPVYGAGGGKDLEAAGAILAGSLKPAQALVLLQLLLRLRKSTAQIAEIFAERGNPHQFE